MSEQVITIHHETAGSITIVNDKGIRLTFFNVGALAEAHARALCQYAEIQKTLDEHIEANAEAGEEVTKLEAEIIRLTDQEAKYQEMIGNQAERLSGLDARYSRLAAAYEAYEGKADGEQAMASDVAELEKAIEAALGQEAI